MTEETTAGSDDGAFYGSKIHHLSYCMAANGQSCSTCQLNFRALKRCWPTTHLPARGTTVRTEIMSSIVYYDEEPMWQNYEQEILLKMLHQRNVLYPSYITKRDLIKQITDPFGVESVS